ncbi:MAG: hypothetical protein PHE59_02020 [Patescibacteria group bacterium]|nr:hypothetical protein [Patescibacteria group bacterium]MDD5164726.1 hypothetical protein [Patescibacteria group bacterium]MDD5534559.1 hypothetical protein [Patescibacteria group bacterium]
MFEILGFKPGYGGRGIAIFPTDPTHFPEKQIVKASWLQQASYELGEFMCRSIPETVDKKFLVMASQFKIRKVVSQFNSIFLIAIVKMNKGFTHGKVTIEGRINDKDLDLALEGEFTFCLKDKDVVSS